MKTRWIVLLPLALLVVLFFFLSSSFPRPAVIDWTEVHQVIDGFGGSCADFIEPFSPAMADFFFTTSGIGLSLLRTQVVPSMEDCKWFPVPGGGSCVPVSSGATILKGELAIAQQAVERGVTIWSTPWSPPGSMKSNGSFVNGGSLLPGEYSAWAASLASYVTLLNSHGVPVYALSVQNEPDLSQEYGSATYTAQQMHDFIPVLRSALRAAGVGSTKIMIAEASTWNFDLTKAAMADPAVASCVGILAAHGYRWPKGGIAAPKNYGKHVWQTEDSSQSPIYDDSMKDALSWASKIHEYLTVANVNAWHWWFLSDGPKYGNGTDNSALTDIRLNYPKRAYVTGQWSRFVRPGWSRIGVDYYFGPLQITAFKDPGNRSFAIVVVNPGKESVTQTFSLKRFSAVSVTPWVTSDTLSLSAQASVPAKGGSFTYAIPASSVTTFSGTVGKSRQ